MLPVQTLIRTLTFVLGRNPAGSVNAAGFQD